MSSISRSESCLKKPWLHITIAPDIKEALETVSEEAEISRSELTERALIGLLMGFKRDGETLPMLGYKPSETLNNIGELDDA